MSDVAYPPIAWLLSSYRENKGLTVRNMAPGEIIPIELTTGLEQLNRLDGNWIWIAEKGGEKLAVLVGAPCHGVALVIRLIAKPNAPAVAILKLLRESRKEAKRRGFLGFAVWLDPERKEEAKLLKIAKRMGAKDIAAHLCVAGKL